MRISFQVLVAVLPETQMQYFDVEGKMWKPLSSLAPAAEAQECYCAETVGSKLYVAGVVSCKHSIYCYDIERDVWENLPYSGAKLIQLCTLGDYMYAISVDLSQIPQRYSLTDSWWQRFARVSLTNGYFDISGATVFHAKLYVLYGKLIYKGGWCMQNAVLHCFDPVRNVWEEKASTCQPHFESNLVVVNSKLHVAGGKVDYNVSSKVVCGNPAPVEIYDEENNKWSVVDQKHIPPNNLGAVEIEGRVYFIINKFPVDSGIRIPPEEVYPVSLDRWENLRNISDKAALCYVPLKREGLKSE